MLVNKQRVFLLNFVLFTQTKNGIQKFIMETQKIALVTGGSRGLGKDMAKQLAAKGLHVILTYNKQKDEAMSVVSDIENSGKKAAALQLDAASVKSFDEFFTRVKTILKNKFDTDHFDYLVNNAGFGLHAPFVETTE